MVRTGLVIMKITIPFLSFALEVNAKLEHANQYNQDMHNQPNLVNRIRKQASQSASQTDMPNPRALPKIATAQELEITETQLGFALPAFLKRLYLEVANGGFGPGYGLIGTTGGASDDRGFITDLHNADNDPKRRTRYPNWPTRAIRICNWGCGMYSLVESSSLQMYLFNPDADETAFPNQLMPHHKTLEEFWQAWTDDTNLLEDAFKTESEVTP
jgi:hypothetical protein